MTVLLDDILIYRLWVVCGLGGMISWDFGFFIAVIPFFLDGLVGFYSLLKRSITAAV
jgi:hypothetical protein